MTEQLSRPTAGITPWWQDMSDEQRFDTFLEVADLAITLHMSALECEHCHVHRQAHRRMLWLAEQILSKRGDAA